MGRFINPFTDVGFKRIFGQEINKDLLIDFLNSLLEGEKKVKDITFLDKELLPEFENDRSVIYDVYCTDESGEEFIVEMQNREHVHFRERAVYYLSRAIARQGEKGADWMFNLKAVYGIFFMNFRMPGQEEHKLRTDVELADRETGKPFSNKMRLIFLELPAFTKEESECENDFERWIYVLKHMETLKRMPFKARKSVFDQGGAGDVRREHQGVPRPPGDHGVRQANRLRPRQGSRLGRRYGGGYSERYGGGNDERYGGGNDERA